MIYLETVIKKLGKDKINHAFNTAFLISYPLPPISLLQPPNFICTGTFRKKFRLNKFQIYS